MPSTQVVPDLNKTSPAELDSAPPRPPASENLMSMQRMGPKPDAGGIGSQQTPQLMTLQGLAMVKHGFNLIANGVPALAQLLANSQSDLEQMVTQAMADTVAGVQPGVTPPPGVAPMMTPPPGAPMGGPPMGGPPGPPQGGPPMR